MGAHSIFLVDSSSSYLIVSLAWYTSPLAYFLSNFLAALLNNWSKFLFLDIVRFFFWSSSVLHTFDMLIYFLSIEKLLIHWYSFWFAYSWSFDLKSRVRIDPFALKLFIVMICGSNLALYILFSRLWSQIPQNLNLIQ